MNKKLRIMPAELLISSSKIN